MDVSQFAGHNIATTEHVLGVNDLFPDGIDHGDWASARVVVDYAFLFRCYSGVPFDAFRDRDERFGQKSMGHFMRGGHTLKLSEHRSAWGLVSHYIGWAIGLECQPHRTSMQCRGRGIKVLGEGMVQHRRIFALHWIPLREHVKQSTIP